MYRAAVDCPHDHGIELECENCRIGCFRPARFKNPNFGRAEAEGDPDKWWLYAYSYAEWLCAEHYDEVMDRSEESYSEEDQNFST